MRNWPLSLRTNGSRTTLNEFVTSPLHFYSAKPALVSDGKVGITEIDGKQYFIATEELATDAKKGL